MLTENDISNRIQICMKIISITLCELRGSTLDALRLFSFTDLHSRVQNYINLKRINAKCLAFHRILKPFV